jgi:hypothetical protein
MNNSVWTDFILGNSETSQGAITDKKIAENVLLTEIGSKWRRLRWIVGTWPSCWDGEKIVCTMIHGLPRVGWIVF